MIEKDFLKKIEQKYDVHLGDAVMRKEDGKFFRVAAIYPKDRVTILQDMVGGEEGFDLKDFKNRFELVTKIPGVGDYVMRRLNGDIAKIISIDYEKNTVDLQNKKSKIIKGESLKGIKLLVDEVVDSGIEMALRSAKNLNEKERNCDNNKKVERKAA